MGNRTMNTEQLKAAFDSLHADDEMADRVLSRASEGGARRRRGAAKPLALVAMGWAVAVLATGGVAYAVVSSGYFAQAWGNHGQGSVQSWSVEGGGAPIPYTREYGDGVAPTDLADAVEHVGISVEGNGYTLTFEDIVADENGCGSVTFVLSNPNGVSIYEPALKIGELVLNGGEGDQTLDTVTMQFGDDQTKIVDTREVVEKDESTDTEIHGTMYFAAASADDLDKDITWTLKWSADRSDGYYEGSEATSEAFRLSKRVAVKTLTSAEGDVAKVSPFSVSLSYDMRRSDGIRTLSLLYNDGSEWVVKGEGVANHYFGYGRDNDVVWIPTELTDLDSLTGVRTVGLTSPDENGDRETVTTDFSLS